MFLLNIYYMCIVGCMDEISVECRKKMYTMSTVDLLNNRCIKNN